MCVVCMCMFGVYECEYVLCVCVCLWFVWCVLYVEIRLREDKGKFFITFRKLVLV